MRNTIKNFVFGKQWNFGDPFTIVIDTRNTKTGGSKDNEFLFPQNSDALDSYIDFLVDWGDGQFSRITSKAEAKVPHVYSNPGIYTLSFYKRKTTRRLVLSPRYELYPNETNKLLKILRWGTFVNSRNCFANCSNLDLSVAEGSPLLAGNTASNFANCRNIFKIKNLDSFVFSNNFGNTFAGCTNFNQECVINVLNSTSTGSGFINCTSLNSQVTLNAPFTTTTASFFEGCTTLNILPVLLTPNVTNVSEMFKNCTNFNKDVSGMFDWSKVTNMTGFMNGKLSTNYNSSYYDNLLIALDNAGRTDVVLGMGAIKHTSAGLAAKNNLVAKRWIITHGGMI